jgi:5-hydroxyisourate hydrolase-like protein (transthyretin family)
MTALLLILALFGQGIPISQAQSGVITGTLKADTGKPAAGVRVSVLAVPEKADDIRYATAMTSQGETDNDGYFRLENTAGELRPADRSVRAFHVVWNRGHRG